MDRDELHERVRRLLFAAPSLAKAFEEGDFRSVFRGRGVEFDSLRDYSTDDDSRLIDFRATARFARPFVRSYREDRSLTVFLLIDVSASMEQGSGDLSKLDMEVLVASLVAYAAQYRGLASGALFFDRAVTEYRRPGRGRAHALALAEAAALYASCADRLPTKSARGYAARMLASQSRPPVARPPASGFGMQGDGLAEAFRAASLMLKRRSLVIALSDFRGGCWARALAQLGMRHDLVALRIGDASDFELPRGGLFAVHDPETGAPARLALGSRSFGARWKRRGEESRAAFRQSCIEARVPSLEIDTADDPVKKLLEFFVRQRRLV